MTTEAFTVFSTLAGMFLLIGIPFMLLISFFVLSLNKKITDNRKRIDYLIEKSNLEPYKDPEQGWFIKPKK